MRLRAALTLSLLLSLASSPLLAAEETEAQLQKGKKLYDEAIPLLEAKKFAEACPKLEEAIRLVPIAVGARLALGECDEGRGRLASALASYRKAESLATAADQPDRARLARERADALKPRVGKLRVTLTAEDARLQGLVVEVDGRALEAAASAAPVEVDAGTHSVRVTATGRAPFLHEVTTTDGKELTVSVTLPPAARSDSTPASDGTSPLLIAGIATGALGVVALGVGGGLGGLAASKNDESFAKGCVKGRGCPAGPATEARQGAYDAAAMSTALFIGGGVLAATGVALVIVGSRTSTKPAVTGLTLRIGPGGLGLQGAFQ